MNVHSFTYRDDGRPASVAGLHASGGFAADRAGEATPSDSAEARAGPPASRGTHASLKDLREISRRCLEGRALGEELSGWLGDALEAFLGRRCHSVDEAFGLRFPQGGVPWWREEAIRRRDAALRDLADMLADTPSVAAKARLVREMSVRYAASSWRFDQRLDAMPGHYANTPKEHLWRALKSGAAMPIGERQLRTILAQ